MAGQEFGEQVRDRGFEVAGADGFGDGVGLQVAH